MPLPFARGRIPIWTYWLIFILLIAAASLAFSASGEEFCGSSAREAVNKREAATCLDFWLNRYQTLLTGLFAIGAAATAYLGVRQQIEATRFVEDERRRREDAAARALLPLALAKIVDYLSRSATVVRRVDRETTDVVELGAFPLETTIDLQNCLRWAEQPEAEQIWQLLASIQVFQSRYVRPFQGMEREQCQIDLCELLTKTERLFNYGRNGHLRPKMTASDIDHAIFFLRFELVSKSLLDLYRSSFPAKPGENDLVIDETELG